VIELLDQIKIHKQFRKILAILEDPKADNYDRLYLVGFLFYVGYNPVEIYNIILKYHKWSNFSRKKTLYGIESGLKARRTAGGGVIKVRGVVRGGVEPSQKRSFCGVAPPSTGRKYPYLNPFYDPNYKLPKPDYDLSQFPCIVADLDESAGSSRDIEKKRSQGGD